MKGFGKNDVMGILLIATIALAMLAAADMTGMFDIRQFARDIMNQDLVSLLGGM